MPQPDQGRPRTSRPTRSGPRRPGSAHSPASASAAVRRGGPARHSGGGPRRKGASAPPRPAPARVSALETALNQAQQLAAPVARSFTELGLPDRLVAALARTGITEPFAIQTRALPDAMAGRDVLGRAQTGSGKTLAFGLPLLTRLAESAASPTAARRPRGLVLVPTRELALQVNDALEPLARALGLRTVTVFGGAPYGRQIDAFRRGVDVVVATPGRLIDLLERGVADLSAVSVAVLDEADFMADLGFLPAVRRILDLTPADGQRLLFSATLDGGVEKLVDAYLTDPALHAVTPATSPVEAMDHRLFTVTHADKIEVAGQIAARPGRTLLFVRTKHGADRLARQLNQRGADATAIHGNLNQNQRQRALAGFAAGSPRALVATDVAARGIHVDDVDLVVHFDPPADAKDYLHRSGRTARAGATGTVIAFAEPDQVAAVKAIHRQASVDADSTTVEPGHPAVLAVAASGTAPVPPPPAPAGEHRSQETRPARRPRPGSRGSTGGTGSGGGRSTSGSRSGGGRSTGGSRSGGGRPTGGGRSTGNGAGRTPRSYSTSTPGA